MQEKFSKFKYFLYLILKVLRDIFIAFFGFLLAFFMKNTSKKERNSAKIIKEDTILKKEVNKNLDFANFNTDSEDKIVLTKEQYELIEDNYLTEIIKFCFLKCLELEEQDLTKKDEEYLKELTIKILPVLEKENLEISKEDKIVYFTENLIIKELEEQLKTEIQLPIENQVITPILIEKQEQEIYPKNITPLNVFQGYFVKKEPIKSNLATNYYNDIEINMPVEEIKNNKEINSISKPIINVPLQELDIAIPSIPTFNLRENVNNTDIKLNEPILENNNEEITVTQSFLEIPNINTENLKQELDIVKNEEVKTPIELDNIKEEVKLPIEIVETPDFKNLDNSIKDITINLQDEIVKEELIDKNYQELEEQLDNLLIKINELKLQKLSDLDLQELNQKEKQVLNLKENLTKEKDKDIKNEVNTLEEPIFKEYLSILELELEKLHLENKLDYQTELLNNLEELELMSAKKARKIEKELLKIKLKRAINTMNIANFPLFRNKFFRFLTMNLFANHELKEFHAILRRKTLEYTPPLITDITKGLEALEDATQLSKENIDYLNFLEIEAFKKYPELTLDTKYLSYLNILKMKFLTNQEKLQKKEKTITKYKLKINKKIRKLKKNVKYNIP